ncbi:S-layer homology domain-containing protein [Desulfoscipio gibsoniae]
MKFGAFITVDLSSFTDASDISAWAEPAMKWANAAGLITRRTATTLAPEGSASRAEVAAILIRFIEGFVK